MRCFLKLKGRYPVTAHAPNFDFRTGSREIKRCGESKRTLKNPFASRLTEFDITLKLLRITDQWYIVPVKFRFGRNRFFLRYFYCSWPEVQKVGSALMPTELTEGLFLLPASIQAQITAKGITQKWNSNNKDCKKKTIETLIWLRRSCGIKLRRRNVSQRRVSKFLRTNVAKDWAKLEMFKQNLPSYFVCS